MGCRDAGGEGMDQGRFITLSGQTDCVTSRRVYEVICTSTKLQCVLYLVAVRQVEHGARVAGIEDRRQPDPTWEGLDKDAVQVVIHNLARPLMVQGQDRLIVTCREGGGRGERLGHGLCTHISIHSHCKYRLCVRVHLCVYSVCVH